MGSTDPDSDRYAGTTIEPPVASPTTFGRAADAARTAGLNVSAWVVCNHNSRLAARYPALRIESVFGDTHEHALCPSNPAVVSYLESVVADLAARDVDGVQLESLGYPNAFHSHGTTFGHAKNHAVTDNHEQALLSLCFCTACRERLDKSGVDIDAAVTLVRDLAESALATPSTVLPSLGVLRERHPTLDQVFDVRADTITGLAKRLAEAAGNATVTYLASDGLGTNPGDLWAGGVVPERVAPSFDRLVALCYTNDPTVAHERVSAFDKRVSIPVEVGVTLDPMITPNKRRFASVLETALDAGAVDYQVYNHALMTDDHLDWITAREEDPERSATSS